LQPGLGYRIEKIFPDDEIKKNALVDPILVFAIDENLELLPIFFQFGGRSDSFFLFITESSRRLISTPFVAAW
jgi:hypothetical protein